MARKNSEEDIMVRLSNHANSISLILDVVDIKALPGGSPLEKVIARQLVELRNRLIHIPVIGPGIAAPKPSAVSSATSAGPSYANKQKDWQAKGWSTLEELGESDNFELDADNNFFCIVCERSMHSNNLLGHVRGMAHRIEVGTEEEDEEEEFEESSDEEEYVESMVDEMADCSNERRLELMWDVVYAVDQSLDNIKPDGKWFFCSLCQKCLNGPIPVVGHVRGTIHRGKQAY